MTLGRKESYSDQYTAAIEKASFDGRYTTSSVVVTLSIALALYNSLEMVLLILATFKRWEGLYFWSLCICNFGVVLYSIGMMLLYFNLGVLWFGKVVDDLGWISMIICQSLVLYSRLGLILDNSNILRAVKWMIIIDSLFLVTLTIVFDFGTTYAGLPSFAEGYYYVEHIQMTVFSLQELIISSLYVWKTMSLLEVIDKGKIKSIIWQLLVLNLIIIGMDIALVTLQYMHLQLYQESIKAFVYSVKLKLELNILSKLVDLVHGNAGNRSMTLDLVDSNTLPGLAIADVQRDVSGQERLGSKFASDEKGAIQHIEDSHVTKPGLSSSVARKSDDADGITQITSQRSRSSARTSGRESDILYAEFLHSMK